MKTVKVKSYIAHKDYDVMVDQELLNMKIKIYDEYYEQTGKVFYEGSVGTFIKERIPTEFLVELITGLKDKDKISYRLSGVQNFIERIR